MVSSFIDISTSGRIPSYEKEANESNIADNCGDRDSKDYGRVWGDSGRGVVRICILYNPGELSSGMGKGVQVLSIEDIVFGGHFHF